MFGVGKKGRTLRKRSFRRPIHGFILVEDAVIVDVHSPGKSAVVGHLHLDVDQHPLLRAAFQPDLDQLINVPPPDFRLRSDLLQFLVQRLVLPAPIDISVRLGKEQFQKRLKEEVEGFFPGTVIIGHESVFLHDRTKGKLFFTQSTDNVRRPPARGSCPLSALERATRLKQTGRPGGGDGIRPFAVHGTAI